MNCGSIAIALSAEYGEVSPGGISLIGSNWRSRKPAVPSQRVIAPMSPMSPMPQLRDDGREKSGTSRPERRDPVGDIKDKPSVQGMGTRWSFLPCAIHKAEKPRDRVFEQVV